MRKCAGVIRYMQLFLIWMKVNFPTLCTRRTFVTAQNTTPANSMLPLRCTCFICLFCVFCFSLCVIICSRCNTSDAHALFHLSAYIFLCCFLLLLFWLLLLMNDQENWRKDAIRSYHYAWNISQCCWMRRVEGSSVKCIVLHRTQCQFF